MSSEVRAFGLHRGPGIAPDVLARRAGAAEDAGFESLWVGDHIALPSGLPGAEEPRLEALAALFYLAAVTSTVRLAAGVLVIPQRNPVLLAKQLTSLEPVAGFDRRLRCQVGNSRGLGTHHSPAASTRPNYATAETP